MRSVLGSVRCALVGAVLLGLGVPLASAQPAPRAGNDAMVPLAPGTRSMEVVEDGAIVLTEPREGAPRRGTIVQGTRVPVRRRVAGTGCPTGVWIELGDDAYVCESSVTPSRAAPSGTAQPPMEGGWALPYSYAFVGFDATRAYARPEDYAADEYAEAYGEGFGLALRSRTTYAGTDFVVTRSGRYVPEDGLRFVHPSEFVGTAVPEGAPLDAAWALRERVVVRSAARGGREVLRLRRLDRVRVLGEERGALRIAVSVRVADEGTPNEVIGYVGPRDLTRARVSARPAEVVGPSERWLDVDTATQTLVAYEGERPVYATLVSTGRGGRATSTPLGVHRLWVKLATSDMDDLEREDVERNYRIEAVPWVQFFAGSNGLHAAFWHDRFGTRHSHGCVNLSARDARALFDFTSPRLPPGWSAVLPTARDPGTIVRVR
jgi:lipoprotein-anchoring transpeptidase ErfK/SrfK